MRNGFLSAVCVGVISLLTTIGLSFVALSQQTQEPPLLMMSFKKDDVQGHAEDPRHPHWHIVRDAFVREHPCCEACGARADLNVHHIVPFHRDRSRELDPSNFIVLCRHHHFHVGHGGRWGSSNPNVVDDCKTIRRLYSRIRDFRED